MEGVERLKGRKILVTGGAGFIGGHLVSELIRGGAQVFVIDIKIHRKSFFALNNLHKKTSFAFLDIKNKHRLSQYFTKHRFDYIFHLAAEPIVEEAYDDPYSALETNIMGTVNILEAVRKHKNIKGIIVASSDKAYGKTKKAYTEESPLQGDHPYDVSKSSADLICQAYYKTYNMPIVITRFGNVYGEGDLHFDRIIPGICEAVIKKKILKIRSDGKYVRDYLYVKDVVDGYIALQKHINFSVGQAYNFSSMDTISVLKLIKKSQDILETKIPYSILNSAKNEIPYQHLDDSKILKTKWWKRHYTIESRLRRVFGWYKKIV